MKRVLLVGEATFLNTGYSKYGREILKRLHATGKYQLAELACYANPEVPEHRQKISQTPWKVYPDGNRPHNVFGEHSFHDVCLDFLPDAVFAF